MLRVKICLRMPNKINLNKTKAPIAIICLSPNSGGMEIDSIKLAQKLSSSCDVVLIAKDKSFIQTHIDNYTQNRNFSLETISFRSSISLNILFNARQIIQKHGIKNVIFFGASELKSLYFSFLGLNINLIIRHGTTKSRPKKDFFHKLIYSDVNYHVSISKHLETNVKHIIPFGKNSQSKLIYPSFSFKKPLVSPHKKLTIVHTGRIAEGKGQVDAIKACEILVKNNFDFTFNILGGISESYKEEFYKFYNSCAYKDHIHLIGFSNNVDAYLENADIFLFPSYGEGFGNSFLEALSHNLVSLAYNNTSFPEFLSLGFYFKLIKNRDIYDLKIELLNVAKNLEQEKEKAKQNHNLAKQLFSQDKEIENYLQILK